MSERERERERERGHISWVDQLSCAQFVLCQWQQEVSKVSQLRLVLTGGDGRGRGMDLCESLKGVEFRGRSGPASDMTCKGSSN